MAFTYEQLTFADWFPRVPRQLLSWSVSKTELKNQKDKWIWPLG